MVESFVACSIFVVLWWPNVWWVFLLIRISVAEFYVLEHQMQAKRFAAGMMRVTDCVMWSAKWSLHLWLEQVWFRILTKYTISWTFILLLALLQFSGRPAITFVRYCGFYYCLLYSFDMRILPVFFVFDSWRKDGKMLISSASMVEVHSVLLMVFPGELVWKSLINSLLWI
jgi:hypothetical protein